MTSIRRGQRAIPSTFNATRCEDSKRDDQPQGRMMRDVARTRLPRMNNSERGKFYRRKYREYEDQLDLDVQRLQSEANELQRLLELRQLLPHHCPRMGLDEVRAATQVVYEGLTRLHERWTSIDRSSAASLMAMGLGEVRPPEPVAILERAQLYPSRSENFIARHRNSSTPLVFKLEMVEIQGDVDGRIVLAYGHLYAQYQPADLNVLFPNARHNRHLAARLLAREVAYNCTYRFYTAAPFNASELACVSVDLDAVGGLLAIIPNLQYVEALLSPKIHSNRFGVLAKEVEATSTNHYSPALLAAAIRVVDEQEFCSSPTPLRPMALSYILS